MCGEGRDIVGVFAQRLKFYREDFSTLFAAPFQSDESQTILERPLWSHPEFYRVAQTNPGGLGPGHLNLAIDQHVAPRGWCLAKLLRL
jgi:hypothetical protein